MDTTDMTAEEISTLILEELAQVLEVQTELHEMTCRWNDAKRAGDPVMDDLYWEVSHLGGILSLVKGNVIFLQEEYRMKMDELAVQPLTLTKTPVA